MTEFRATAKIESTNNYIDARQKFIEAYNAIQKLSEPEKYRLFQEAIGAEAFNQLFVQMRRWNGM